MHTYAVCMHESIVYIILDLVTQCNKRQTSDAIKRERERERKVNKRIRNYTFDFFHFPAFSLVI